LLFLQEPRPLFPKSLTAIRSPGFNSKLPG
jgi:hypothetical protein